MRKHAQKALIDTCATIAASGDKITSYIFIWETDDGALHRASHGSRMSNLGMLKVYSDRIADEYRDFVNHPKEN